MMLVFPVVVEYEFTVRVYTIYAVSPTRKSPVSDEQTQFDCNPAGPSTTGKAKALPLLQYGPSVNATAGSSANDLSGSC